MPCIVINQYLDVPAYGLYNFSQAGMLYKQSDISVLNGKQITGI
jgi:hypothetical protein